MRVFFTPSQLCRTPPIFCENRGESYKPIFKSHCIFASEKFLGESRRAHRSIMARSDGGVNFDALLMHNYFSSLSIGSLLLRASLNSLRPES